jgi:tetrahedral aminopeptidase
MPLTDRNIAAIPEIGPEQIALLERLSNAVAVSGDEGEVRAIVLEQLKDQPDTLIRVDALGSVLVTRTSTAAHPMRAMIAAHMDEVGFMLVDEDEGGLFQFQLVGGVDVRQLPGKPVLAGKDRVPGVIGARPIHLTTASERHSEISLDSMRIDLGPSGQGKAKVGDRATFATRFAQVGPSLMGKALDDRLGVATLIELVKHAPPEIELLAAFTVQEEVGLRGAQVAAYALAPDLAIALDSVPAYDLPTWDDSENAQYNTRLDAGPALYVADTSTLSDPRLVAHFINTAKTAGIPYQIRQPGSGGTDAGSIHRQRSGIPSISISVPGRYSHTAVLVARLADWQNTLALLYEGLRHLSPSIFEIER